MQRSRALGMTAASAAQRSDRGRPHTASTAARGGGTSGMEGHSSLQPRWTPAAAAADPGRTALT